MNNITLEYCANNLGGLDLFLVWLLCVAFTMLIPILIFLLWIIGGCVGECLGDWAARKYAMARAEIIIEHENSIKRAV